MRPRLSSLLLLAMTSAYACGDDRREPATLVPEEQPAAPSPTRPPNPPSAPTPPTPVAAPIEPLPVAEPGSTHVFEPEIDLDFDVDAYLEPEPVRRPRGEEHEVTFPRFDHPDDRLERLLNERVAAIAVAQDREQPANSPQDTACEAKLALKSIVSMLCTTTIWDERDDHTHIIRAVHLAIDDAGVHDLTLSALFLPGTDFAPLVRAACAEDSECDSRHPYALALTSSGLHIESYEEVGNFYSVQLEIPYPEISERLLATGPLARSLEPGSGRTRVVPIDPAGTATPATLRWAVLPMSSFGDLASAWASLPVDQRANVTQAGSFLVAPDAATATAAAATLGQQPFETAAPAPVPLAFVAAQRDLELLREPTRGAEAVGTVLRGTLLVLAPAPEEDRYVFAVAHAGRVGYVDRRQLAPVEGCVPELAPFLASLPESTRALARTRTMRNLLREGDWGRATYTAEIGAESHVELRRLEAECAVERSLVRFTRPGVIESFAVTRTAARGGESLIVTVSGPPRAVTIHTFGRSEPRWTRSLDPAERIATSRRDGSAWYPLAIEREGAEPVRVAWGPDGPIP